MPRVRAPELPSDQPWLNCSGPLSLKQLQGRIVILDFWTYCCINCLHVLPTLKFLEQKYRACLTVIGIHSGKFDHEKDADNIRQAILRYDIEHPVLVDPNFEVWQQYAVRAWPTLVLIDPKGYVVDQISGEADLHVLDQRIHATIQAHPDRGAVAFEAFQPILEKHKHPLMTPLAFPGKVLAADQALFVADSGHHRLVVSSLTGEVQHVIGSGTSGFKDGGFIDSQFCQPQGMAFDQAQHVLYVADMGNHAIRRVDFRRKLVETIAGTGMQSRYLRPHGGQALNTDLNSPWDLVKIGHEIFIAMAGSHQIWQLDLPSGKIQTYAGTGAEACVDGPIDLAAFAQPSGITTDGQALFVADSESSTIRSLSLNSIPEVQSICGSGALFGFGDRDGQGDEVRLQHCLGIELGSGQGLWVADTYNHKIKWVDLQTKTCRSLLASGETGFQDQQGNLVCFAEPSGLSQSGQFLYVADTNHHAIRRIDLETIRVETLIFPGLCSPTLCFPELPV